MSSDERFEDWTQIKDFAKRRRMQTRNAQRKYRKKKREQNRELLEECNRSRSLLSASSGFPVPALATMSVVDVGPQDFTRILSQSPQAIQAVQAVQAVQTVQTAQLPPTTHGQWYGYGLIDSQKRPTPSSVYVRPRLLGGPLTLCDDQPSSLDGLQGYAETVENITRRFPGQGRSFIPPSTSGVSLAGIDPTVGMQIMEASDQLVSLSSPTSPFQTTSQISQASYSTHAPVLAEDNGNSAVNTMPSPLSAISTSLTESMPPPNLAGPSLGVTDAFPLDPTLHGAADSTPSSGDDLPGDFHHHMRLSVRLANSSTTTANANAQNSRFVIDMDAFHVRTTLLQSAWHLLERSLRVVNKDVFLEHRERGERSEYYSAFLEAAMLACAARTSTSPAVRKLSRAYADQAKQYITGEIEHPTMAAMQGFLFLGDFEAFEGCDVVGWIYHGIALRLLSVIHARDDDSPDSRVWNETRAWILVYNNIWSLQMNQCSSVPVDALVHNPHICPANASERMLPHWITLCTHLSSMSAISGKTFANKSEACAAIEDLLELGTRLHASYRNLPRVLAGQSTTDMSAFSLNMEFCGLQLALHRRIIIIFQQNVYNQQQQQPQQIQQGQQGQQSQQSQHQQGQHQQDQQEPENRARTAELSLRVDQSCIVMYENALEICKLALAFRELLGVESIPTIFLNNIHMAASTIILHISQPLPLPASRHGLDADSQLSIALESLRNMAGIFNALHEHFPVTAKMSRILSQMTENTPAAGMFGSVPANDNTSPGGLGPASAMVASAGSLC